MCISIDRTCISILNISAFLFRELPPYYDHFPRNPHTQPTTFPTSKKKKERKKKLLVLTRWAVRHHHAVQICYLQSTSVQPCHPCPQCDKSVKRMSSSARLPKTCLGPYTTGKGLQLSLARGSLAHDLCRPRPGENLAQSIITRAWTGNPSRLPPPTRLQQLRQCRVSAPNLSVTRRMERRAAKGGPQTGGSERIERKKAGP